MYTLFQFPFSISDAGTGEARGATAPHPQIFGRSVNHIPTMGGRVCPPFITDTPRFFHLPASLYDMLYIQKERLPTII